MTSITRWLVCLSCLWLPLEVLTGQTNEFHVAPGGSDTNPGTQARPFLSITRARDAVRSFRGRNPHLSDTVFVRLHGGQYRITGPLMFGPEDSGTPGSPTVFAAYKGERPVVSGGLHVTRWKEATLDGRRVWSASVPTRSGGTPIPVRQLWVNGVRRSPARLPNTGYLTVAAVPEAGPKTEWMEGQKSFVVQKGDIPPGAVLDGAIVVVMNRWVESHMPVTGFTSDSGLLSFGRRSVFRLEKGDPYYLLHARSGLDTPGEWWYDAGHSLLFYVPIQGEDRKTIDAVVPLCAQLVRMTGVPEQNRWVEHMIFRGIEFSHTEWFFPEGFQTDYGKGDLWGFPQAATGVPAAIACSGVRFCRFEKSQVTHVGTYGISLGASCLDNTVVGCELGDLGGGGLQIGLKTLVEDKQLLTARNILLDNHIHDGGRIFHSAIGVWIGQSPENRLIHNHIHDFYYSALSIGWTWGYGSSLAGKNLIEGNHIHHIGVLSNGDGPILSDMGGVYTLGTQRGTVIRRNVFHDISARIYGGWGIYFDEGSTGILAEQNLVYRTRHGGFHQHYGRENIFRNNILAFGEEYQARRTRAENHTSFAFEKNIVIWAGGKLFDGNLRDGDMVLDRNLYWPLDGEFRADSLTFSAWQALGYDKHSRVADPLFMDAKHDDFRLREGSPALALGFEPFEISPVLDARATNVFDQEQRPETIHRRFIYNNDGSNILMAYDSLTPRKAYERIDPLAGTGITTFFHNVNPGQNPGYPSKVDTMYHWSSPPTDAGQGWGVSGRRMSDNLAKLTREGTDPVALVLDRARLRGLEPFVSLRMNELHDVDKPESPLLSSFWKAHPEYRVGGYEGWGKEALNYALPQVREHFLSWIREIIDRYDYDGLEMDFMRFPYYFPLHADSMSHYTEIMTGFVQQVRRLTDSLGTARGHRILLAARVPSSLHGCEHLGVDPATWCRKGSVDLLTVSPFLSTETDIPVAEFKTACGSVPVYTGIEFTIGTRQMTREEKRAAAALLYASGADGMYLFNYFVAWDYGLQADTEVLPELADPALLTGKDKLYTLAVPRYPVPGVSLPGQVPLRLGAGEEGQVTVRIHEPVRPTSAVLRIECAGPIAPLNIRVRLNGKPLVSGHTPSTPQIFAQKGFHPLPEIAKTVEFDVDPNDLQESNTLSLRVSDRAQVDWVYLAVKHADTGTSGR
jgi:hypothetical protein